MIYTVFLFTNQRIFIFCLIGGIEMEEIVGCSTVFFDAAGLPAALTAAPAFPSEQAQLLS
jgi:hypothetical protein